jgi:hypothetical protein
VLRGLCDLLEAIEGMPPNAEASAVGRMALRALERYAHSFPIGEPSHLHFRGTRERGDGHKRRARASFERGLRAARSMHLPAEQELLDADLAALEAG